ncbi:MAG: glutamine--tRNA ligase/YqeY domain fusion protein [Christensenellales bacterium]|jgi:glutaminyl-tRNA synthetase
MNFEPEAASNFIEEIVVQDLKSGKYEKIVTRFPPEPNGYLHIGHSKAFLLDFGIAEKYQGQCNLRFDDTNPVKEDTEYVENIMQDIRFLGCDWGDGLHYASDYFDQLYAYAEQIIEKGLAYVDFQTAEQMRATRGTLTEPGQNSPYRDATPEETLALFRKMKAGEYKEGECCLRAKIDMASPNMNMRDPAMYRIMYTPHHRTGTKWCIYPMYDFAHPVSDAIEGVTHSICTLEFEDHRPLYDWFLQAIGFENPPHQYEFARLNIEGTIMSKRYLRRMVEEGFVSGWDDPRMPTICGLRRKGYTKGSIRQFCATVGVAKSNSTVEPGVLEHCLRDDLKPTAPRRMAVLDPIELVIENYPEGKSETLTIANNAENEALGTREITFSKHVYIERDDFAIVPPPKYKRLSPEKEVRLMGAYIVKCTGYETDEEGNVTRVLCTYDEDSASGTGGRKVKGVLHWVDKNTAVDAEVRLYENLVLEGEGDFTQRINPNSLSVRHAKVEASLSDAAVQDSFQFIRIGYFCADPDGKPGAPVFNRSVGLKDSWAKQVKK